jgi:hypothetical protein
MRVGLYNQNLEGSRILLHLQDLNAGSPSKDIDVLLVGTSRTMADYDPKTIARTFAEKVPLKKGPDVENFGDLGNYPSLLENYLHENNIQEKLLILEFSPHIFLLEPEDSQTHNLYRTYQMSIHIFELLVDGWVKKTGDFEELGWLRPSSFFHVFNKPSYRSLSCGEKFDNLRVDSFGYGQKLSETGQVLYYTHVPDRQVAEYVKPNVRSEYESFKDKLLIGSFKETEWEAYQRIILEAKSKGSVVVVRPAVDPAMYDLENEMASAGIRKLVAFLESQNIPFIDMNPTQYHSMDMSHIDWYDTTNLSSDLAIKIIPIIDWTEFSLNE